jgi:hypothetical protein
MITIKKKNINKKVKVSTMIKKRVERKKKYKNVEGYKKKVVFYK